MGLKRKVAVVVSVGGYLTYPLGKGVERTVYGPWHIPVKYTNVLCSDGVRRTVHCRGRQPDTFFSQPGDVSVKGKTVTGFISYDSLNEEWEFTAYSYRKNGGLLP